MPTIATDWFVVYAGATICLFAIALLASAAWDKRREQRRGKEPPAS